VCFLVTLGPDRYTPGLMTTFHVVADAGDTAEELRSLGGFEAPSARLALDGCLAHVDHDPADDRVSGPVDRYDVMDAPAASPAHPCVSEGTRIHNSVLCSTKPR
jgi:hypothetical protein